MRSYEVTERGKIVIAVILVLLIFVIPAIIFVAIAGASPPPPPEAPEAPNASSVEPLPIPPEDTSPEVPDRPLPNGSGLTPHDPSNQEPPKNGDDNGDDNGIGNNEPDATDPPPETPAPQPEIEPARLNLNEGTMLFVFSPDSQDAMDDATVSMFGEFITSPRNTAGAMISIETPNLSDDDNVALKSAIADAFSRLGITRGRLVYIQSEAEPGEHSFEVKMSFYLTSSGK